MNAFAWSIALNRMLFPLWSVSASSNFSVWDFSQNKAANARIFIFIPPYTPGFGSVVHGATAWRLLVTYGCCLWPLDAYVIEPPNRGCLIMLLNTPPNQGKLRCHGPPRFWIVLGFCFKKQEGAGGPYSGSARAYGPSLTSSIINHIIKSMFHKTPRFRATVGFVGFCVLASPEDRFRGFWAQ